ncbi:hypothetical protein HK097_006644 [Rhizophlyctis rosea]|uniref:Uncharacterized protein n=1 Tax=Rhizophlyctis rosea TaxID=64517 RepID=A0AAD5X527_9FUNG|nr:hypothetical protein HK097_006644 [Rhizophlyctis rosea]
MPKISKYQEGAQEILAPVDQAAVLANHPELQTLFAYITPVVEGSKAHHTVTKKQIEDILHIDVSNADIDSTSFWLREEWELPPNVEIVEPSTWLKKGVKKIVKLWAATSSENLSRTLIDLTLLDVLDRTEFEGKLRAWGGVKLRYVAAAGAMEGYADYGIGHADVDSDEPAKTTFLLIVEAKRQGEKVSLWQLIAYLGILHQKRKALGKLATVYGIWSTGAHCRFLRIDEGGKAWVSGLMDHISKIYQWCHYAITCAYISNPTTTPSTLQEHLDLVEDFTKISLHLGVEFLEEEESDSD